VNEEASETEEAAEAAVLTVVHARCTRQHVPNVVKNAKFHSNLQKEDQFSAKNASRNTESFKDMSNVSQ